MVDLNKMFKKIEAFYFLPKDLFESFNMKIENQLYIRMNIDDNHMKFLNIGNSNKMETKSGILGGHKNVDIYCDRQTIFSRIHLWALFHDNMIQQSS